jgi:putative tricarboxylic transport membrane protein
MPGHSPVKQLTAGVAVVLLSLLVWLESRGFPELPDGHPGPALFPRVIAIGLFLSGAYLTVSALLPEREPALEPAGRTGVAGGVARIAVVTLALAAYPFASDLLGFIPTISAISLLVALLLKARPLQGALTAVGGTLVIYLLFTRVLGVPL